MRTIDIFALLASAAVAIILTINTLRKSEISLRAIAAFFMFFGPAVIFVHMSCHIGEISYHAVQKLLQGAFTYDFRFYSLMLMAAVLVYCCGTLLQRIKKFLEGDGYADILKSMALIFFVSAPTIAFTPIGSLPIMACIVTLTALPFVKKVKRVALSLNS